MKKILTVIISLIILVLMSACSTTEINGARADMNSTIKIANSLQENQPTPTDIDYIINIHESIRKK